MAEYIRTRIGETEVLFETDAATGAVGYSVGQKVVEAAEDGFKTALKVARGVADTMSEGFGALNLESAEVSFGIKFSSEGGVVIAKAAGEASLTITLVIKGPKSRD